MSEYQFGESPFLNFIKEERIKRILNKGFTICCPDCHSQEYDFYHTGINPFSKDDPINDIWYICKCCSKKWSSEFLVKS